MQNTTQHKHILTFLKDPNKMKDNEKIIKAA